MSSYKNCFYYLDGYCCCGTICRRVAGEDYERCPDMLKFEEKQREEESNYEKSNT